MSLAGPVLRGLGLTVGVGLAAPGTGAKGAAVAAILGISVGSTLASRVGVAVRGIRVGVAVDCRASMLDTEGPTRPAANTNAATIAANTTTEMTMSAGTGTRCSGLGKRNDASAPRSAPAAVSISFGAVSFFAGGGVSAGGGVASTGAGGLMGAIFGGRNSGGGSISGGMVGGGVGFGTFSTGLGGFADGGANGSRRRIALNGSGNEAGTGFVLDMRSVGIRGCGSGAGVGVGGGGCATGCRGGGCGAG